MAKNLTRKFFYTDCSWTAPIEVTQVTVTTLPVDGLRSVSASEDTSFVRTAAGLVFGMGANSCGQLGDGSLTARCFPTQVSATCVTVWRTMNATNRGGSGLSFGGQLVGWGCNNFSEIGDNSATVRCFPVGANVGCLFKGIGTGNNHVVSISSNGCGFSWGDNTCGKLGIGSITNQCNPQALSCGFSWRMISASESNSGGLAQNGDIYMWGSNTSGQVGNCSATGSFCVPTPVCGGLKFKFIEVSNVRGFGITESGDLYSWGSGTSGALGSGATSNRCVPGLVCGGLKWKRISASKLIGGVTVMGISCDGSLYGWGSGICGILGTGALTCYCVPTLVFGGFKWKEVSVGSAHALALTEDGYLYSWGNNRCGQLGLNDLVDRCLPTLVCGSSIAGATEPQYKKDFKVIPLSTYCIRISHAYSQFNNEPISDFTQGIVLEYFS